MKKRFFVLLVVFVFTAMFVGSTLNLQASSDKVYLSDQQGIIHNLYPDPNITDGINKGLQGAADTIVVGGVTYEKGFMTHPIGVSSPSEIIVNVKDLTTEKPILHMVVGKDDGAFGGGYGHTYRYEVLADGNQIYLSESMDVDSVEEMFFDVTGAEEISILCHCDGPFAWLTVNFADVYLCSLEVKEVRLSKAPFKTEYIEGEALSVVGGELEVIYENDFSAAVTVTSDMVSGFDTNTPGDQELTITYGEQTFTYTVKVTALPDPTPTTVPTTQAPATDAPNDGEKSGSCGSSSAIAQVMLVLGAALIIKKRK